MWRRISHALSGRKRARRELVLGRPRLPAGGVQATCTECGPACGAPISLAEPGRRGMHASVGIRTIINCAAPAQGPITCWKGKPARRQASNWSIVQVFCRDTPTNEAIFGARDLSRADRITRPDALQIRRGQAGLMAACTSADEKVPFERGARSSCISNNLHIKARQDGA